MIFQKYIEYISKSPQVQKGISIYPIGEYNLEGLKTLIDNCVRMGADNNNVEIATVSPGLWLGQILDKHLDKISYVSSLPQFEILKIENGEVVSRTYKHDLVEFSSDEELDEFFNKRKFKTLVLFYITKTVNLSTLKSKYIVRYSDITEKYEERDLKINNILNGANNN